MISKNTQLKIDNWIKKGFRYKYAKESLKCCQSFLAAWNILQESIAGEVKDFTRLTELQPLEESNYDWNGWVWEIIESLDTASKQYPESLQQSLEFIDSFLQRFPNTSDVDLMERLQRLLIKTHFLLTNDAEGVQAVKNYYKKYPYAVWGYIEWGDALLKRTTTPDTKLYEQVLKIYQKGLNLNDDPDFIDILKGRIARLKKKRKLKAV